LGKGSKPPPHQLRCLREHCKLTQWGPGRSYGKCGFCAFQGLKNQVISTFHGWLAVSSFCGSVKNSFYNRWGKGERSVDPSARRPCRRSWRWGMNGLLDRSKSGYETAGRHSSSHGGVKLIQSGVVDVVVYRLKVSTRCR